MSNYSICILKKDDDLTIIRANSAFYETLGYSEEEVHYKYANHLSALLLPETQYIIREMVESAPSKSHGSFDHLIRNNHDKEIWLHSEVDLTHLQDETPIIRMFSYDITDLATSKHDAKLLQQQFFSTCQFAHIGVVDFSLDSRIIEMAATTNFFEETSLVNETFPDVLFQKSLIHPDDTSKIEEICERLTQEESGLSCELRIHTGPEEYKWVSLSFNPQMLNGENHIIAIFTDRSAEKEATLKYLNEALFYQALLSSQTAYGHLDITDNKVLRVGGLWVVYNEIIDQISYSTLIEEMIQKVVHPDDRARYTSMMDIDNLRKAPENGLLLLSCDFRRIVEQNKMIWIKSTISIFEHPITHHLMGMLYLRNIDDSSHYALPSSNGENVGQSDYLAYAEEFDEEFDNFLGENGEIAYLVDPRNYELLCGNQAFYNRIGMTKEECKGRKCYQLIHKRNLPCSFCANANWSTDHFYMYRNYNEALDQEFLIKNKLVSWHSKQILLAMAIDLSNNKTVLDTIENSITEDRVIISGIQNMQASKDLRAAISSALESIQKFYMAKAVRFWSISHETQVYTCDIFYLASGLKSGTSLADSEEDKRKINTWLRTRKWADSLIITNPQEMLYHSYDLFHRMELQQVANSGWFLLRDEFERELGIIEIVDIKVNFQNEHFLNSFLQFLRSEWQKREMVESIIHASYHDTMTGLWNRASFEEYMTTFSENDADSVGVITFNIDGIKKINESLGFPKGNHCICMLAEILSNEFQGIKVYRLSGDEFLTILTNITQEEMEQNIFSIEEHLSNIKQFTVSIGYSWDNVEKELDGLIEFATQSMHLNKTRYYNTLKTSNQERIELQGWVSDAIEQDNMMVYLQPKVDTRINRAVGAEALIRCKGQDNRIIPPAKFIPPLEKHNLIRYIDFFVFEDTCKLLERWKKENRNMIKISLNFSRLTLTENDLIISMENIISKYDVDKKYIEIEITESYAGIGKALLNQSIKKLHNAGYTISLDDFGTKYTNLSILSYVEAEVLKIDKSLIHSMETDTKTQIILKNMVSMCSDLGIDIVAEGVESQAQADILYSLGCCVIQGYLYSKPIPIDQFEDQFLV